MDKQKKKKLIGCISLIMLGMSLVSLAYFKPISVIEAKSENSKQQTFKTSRNLVPGPKIENAQSIGSKMSDKTRALGSVGSGDLKFTPQVLTIQAGYRLPDLRSNTELGLLFSERPYPNSSQRIGYSYVNEKGEEEYPQLNTLGFYTIYVKVVEYISSTELIVPIPVTVIDEKTSFPFNGQVAMQMDLTYNKIVLYPDETKNKTAEQLKQLVKTRSNIHAWNMETGEDVPVNIVSTTIVPTSIGTYKANFVLVFGSGAEQKKETIQKDVVVFGATPQAAVRIEKNELFYVSGNPTNLFTKFQTVGGTMTWDATYDLVDEKGEPLEKFDTSEVGFRWAYIRMTEKYAPEITTVIKVPVSVTDRTTKPLLQNRVMVQVDEKVVLYPDEIAEKNPEELAALAQSKANLRAWDMGTGEEVPVSFIATTIVDQIGTYTGTIQVEFKGLTANTTCDILVFGAMLRNPGYLTVDRTIELKVSSNAETVFEKYQTLNDISSEGATYEWVSNKLGEPTVPPNGFDSSRVGFKRGYIKMTDKTDPTISTVIPIPVTVTAEGQTALIDRKIALKYDAAFIYQKEIKDKTAAQIIDVLTNKLRIEAWQLTSGKEADGRISSTTMTAKSHGKQEATITITSGENSWIHKINLFVLPDSMTRDVDLSGWQQIPLNSSEGKVTNSINSSMIGFPKRGLKDNVNNSLGFSIQDNVGKGYVFSGTFSENGRVTNIPGVNNKVLYGSSWNRAYGLGSDQVASKIAFQYFYRKGNQLKEILVDEVNEILYVYDLSLNRNLNFSVQLNMFNISEVTKSFSMLESVDTDYHSDNVPIYSLEDNRGFYMKPSAEQRFTVNLKDANGNWLSEYRKYIAAEYSYSGVAAGENYFGNNFTKSGLEDKNLQEGDVIQRSVDTSYQLGAPWKNIVPGEALKTGYEIFAGEKLPYMKIKANPEEVDVYQDYNKEFNVEYALSQIPTVTDYGTVYATYPDGSEEQFSFRANNVKEFASNLTIPRSTLPEHLNEEPGTIKNYNTGLIAINEADGAMKGLPSNDYTIKINIYNMGGTPIAQTVKKDSKWNKDVNDLIKDPVVLPGHSAKFTYVNEKAPIDTSKEGLNYVDIQMTDNDEPTQTKVIKVPVMVVKGTLPSNGVMIGANDFSLKKTEVAHLSSEDINKLILKKSEAFGWDIETGLSEGVELSVTKTTLTNDPEATGTYSATIQAKKGTSTKTKTIQISLGANVTVNFLDEKGNLLHDPYTSIEEVGSTLNLNKIEELSSILAQLKKENYDLVKKPDNENLVIAVGENTVAYQFSGTLKLISAPTVLDFEMKKATIDVAKYAQPKIVGAPLVVSDTRADKLKWNLKAKINQPLTSLEDGRAKLPNSIKYKYQDDELTLTNEDRIIFSPLDPVSGSYNITQERWSKGDGFLLDLAPGSIKALGKYRAQITITLENAK